MNLKPPSNSGIEIKQDSGNISIIVNEISSMQFINLAIIIFTLFWLGGWAFGWFFAFKELMNSKEIDLFLLFWLGGWSIGGIFAIFFLYRLMKPSIPEALQLKNNFIDYDSGVPSFKFKFNISSQIDMLKQIFPKRVRFTLNKEDFKTLKLREYQAGNRLTIDTDGKRIEIGKNTTEIGREWLYETLKKRYS